MSTGEDMNHSPPKPASGPRNAPDAAAAAAGPVRANDQTRGCRRGVGSFSCLRSLCLVTAFLVFIVGCDDSKTAVSVPAAPDAAPPAVKEDAKTVALTFPYGSEKKAWIEQVTKRLQREGTSRPGAAKPSR